MDFIASANLLMNGSFAGETWNRTYNADAGMECAVWRQTYGAERWKVRYGHPRGGAVTQARCDEAPQNYTTSVEIRGAEGVREDVFLGQRIEAAEAPRYRNRLFFSTWVQGDCEPSLIISTALAPDIFGNAFNSNVRLEAAEALTPQSPGEVAAKGEWRLLGCEFDARGYSANGLSVELRFPAVALDAPHKVVRVAGAWLTRGCKPGMACDPGMLLEKGMRRRFFQRYDATTLNAVGRALAVSQDEMLFQFTFPEMRGSPDCTLPSTDERLCVFSPSGAQVSGFVYDVTDRSRGSVIIRATKRNHGLRDGYLVFAGSGAAILLDAEL
jgi:hypothetical protein